MGGGSGGQGASTVPGDTSKLINVGFGGFPKAGMPEGTGNNPASPLDAYASALPMFQQARRYGETFLGDTSGGATGATGTGGSAAAAASGTGTSLGTDSFGRPIVPAQAGMERFANMPWYQQQQARASRGNG